MYLENDNDWQAKLTKAGIQRLDLLKPRLKKQGANQSGQGEEQ